MKFTIPVNRNPADTIVRAISNNYLAVTKNPDEAMSKAIQNIDEVIDAFNALEDFITEIDNKNRNYINSTIGKIKFLLSTLKSSSYSKEKRLSTTLISLVKRESKEVSNTSLADRKSVV